MIDQQINLYQNRFKKQKVILSAVQIGGILALLLLVVIVSSWWIQTELGSAQQRNKELIAKQAEVQQQFEALQSQLEKIKADNPWSEKIARLSQHIGARKLMINYLDRARVDSGQSFTSQLKELSAFRVSDVWLSEISLAENSIRLEGSALREEKVPEYFSEFRRRDLFEGMGFDLFEVKRLEEQAWKVDFIIASREKSDE